MVVSSTSKRRPLWVLAAGFTNASRAEPPTTELGSENSGRPALPGEWRRRRPGGVASVGACRQEPFGLHSPGKAQLPQNPGATQERPEATTLGATGGRPAPLVRLEATGGRSAPLVRLEATGGRSALPGEWRRRRPGGVASVGASRQEPFGLHSPGKAQLPQNPGALPTKPGLAPTKPGALPTKPSALPHKTPVPLIPGNRRAPLHSTSGRMAGNSSTSRIEALSVSSITRRSMPMPSPAVGGRPYSRART